MAAYAPLAASVHFPCATAPSYEEAVLTAPLSVTATVWAVPTASPAYQPPAATNALQEQQPCWRKYLWRTATALCILLQLVSSFTLLLLYVDLVSSKGFSLLICLTFVAFVASALLGVLPFFRSHSSGLLINAILLSCNLWIFAIGMLMYMFVEALAYGLCDYEDCLPPETPWKLYWLLYLGSCLILAPLNVMQYVYVGELRTAERAQLALPMTVKV